MNKKYLLIVNPSSGQGRYKIFLDKIERYFKKNKMPLDVIFTRKKDHATAIARKASRSDKYGVIIGAGGDGTINEVLTGIIGSKKKIAIIPWGTGNVFAREMNIPFSPKKIFKIIKKGKSIKIDIGRCNKKYFFLMTSAGFDAYSIKQTEKTNLKKFLGKLSYIAGSIAAFTRYNFPEIKVEIDGKKHESGTFVLVSNTSRYAMYFTITPRAIPNDGLFDVYIFKEAGKFNFLKLLAKIILSAFSKTYRKKSAVFLIKQSFHKAKKIKLSSAGKVLTQIDGDLHESLPVNIKIIPNAVEVILPEKVIKRYKKYSEKG
jgi:diacylglycerol kinase (ATP)